MALSKQDRRLRIRRRIRKTITGSGNIPRLSVFRSNKDIYVQLIDDEQGKTLMSGSSLKMDAKGKSKIEVSFEVGKSIAAKATEHLIHVTTHLSVNNC